MSPVLGLHGDDIAAIAAVVLIWVVLSRLARRRR